MIPGCRSLAAARASRWNLSAAPGRSTNPAGALTRLAAAFPDNFMVSCVGTKVMVVGG